MNSAVVPFRVIRGKKRVPRQRPEVAAAIKDLERLFAVDPSSAEEVHHLIRGLLADGMRANG